MPYCNHLWFMYSLIVCYILTPLLYDIVRDDKRLNYFITIWIGYAVVYGIINNYSGLGIAGYWNINIAGGYLGWYVIGYKLYHCKCSQKPEIYLVYFMISDMLTLVLMLIDHKIAGEFDVYIHDFFSPTVIVASISLFMFIKSKFGHVEYSKMSNVERFVSIFAPLTANVYFVHFLIRDIFLNLDKTQVWGAKLYFVLCPILTLTISVAISYGISWLFSHCDRLVRPYRTL